MKNLKKRACLVYIICALLLFPHYSAPQNDSTAIKLNRGWEKQLNELNYLIMRTSAINIIYGLSFSPDQVKGLKNMCKEVESTSPILPDMRGKASTDASRVRNSFLRLVNLLIDKKEVPKDFKNKVIQMRIKEAEIIKRSILGSQKSGYRGTGCLECHAPPNKFPAGDISKLKTKKISKSERKRIDTAHLNGIFGEQGTSKLWNLRSQVDSLLMSGQKYILKDFQCCLFPPDSLKNPTRIGQAFPTDKWIKHLTDIRGYSRQDWDSYKQLYMTPLGDILEATQPGIDKKDKKKVLNRIEQILEEARQLDDVDFELKKESLCLRIRDELDIGEIIRENNNEKDIRQFKSAMFLLLPGNVDIYDRALQRRNSQ